MTPRGRALVELVERALSGAPTAGSVDPWLGWLVLCLCRQRARQTWLLEVHRTFLRGAPEDRRRDVPGLEGWSYDYHGGALHLLGPDGESIEVQIMCWSEARHVRYEQDGATIDAGFFAFGVRSEQPRGLAGRVWRWLPGIDVILAGVRELQGAGVLVGAHHVRLCDDLEALHVRVAALDLDVPEVLRRLAPFVGDPEPDARDVRPVLARHHAWLLGLLADRRRAGGVVDAVGREVGPDALVRASRELLAGPVDWTTAQTVDALEQVLDGPDYAVVALLDRLTPEEPRSVRAVLRYLLSRGMERPRAVAALRAFGVHGRERPNAEHYALAILACEHAPELVLPVVRSALRSRIPVVLEDMATFLVLVDHPWCHRELAAALIDPREPRELELLQGVISGHRRAWHSAPREDADRLRERLAAEL